MSVARAKISARTQPKVSAPQRVERIALPHRAAMASRYGSAVAHLPVYSGPAVATALKRRGAEGAAVDGAIFLPDAAVAADLVAHEVVHALQQPLFAGDGIAALHQLEVAPACASQSAVENEAQVLAGSEGVLGDSAPVHTLPAGVVALRRSGPDTSAEVPASETATPSSTPAVSEPVAVAEVAAPQQDASATATAATETQVAPTFTAPGVPESALDPAAMAAREAAKVEAEAALAAADSPSAVMDAFAHMAPSVKALNSSELGTRLADANASSTGELTAQTPQISAQLSGAAENLPAPAPIVVPGEKVAAPLAKAAAPEIKVPAGPEQPQLRTDPAYGPAIERMFSSGADPKRIGHQIDKVSTSNPGIQTSVIDRADIPLEGANDPARMDAAVRERGAEATSGLHAASTAVVTGTGPEAIAPREMEHSVAIEASLPETAPLAEPEGAAQFAAMTLPVEVVDRFDADTGPAMAASAETARAEMQAAEDGRDSAHASAAQTADAGRVAAEQQADASQREQIVNRRESIQNERQRTVDEQHAAVQQVNADAEVARVEHRADADERVRTDRAQIDSTYAKAERDSEAKVASGERRAEDERQSAEREADDQSWWRRATSFIRRAFEALTSALTAIFDAVRSAVATIIDAAVSAVTAIITAAALALQALVSSFGELLKGLVDGLLGTVFPELAAALTQFIDQAVAEVNAAIDVVSDVLITAVNEVAAALNAAINALLDVFQSAINTAMGMLQALMTGDWGAVLLKILDAILGILGIDPAAFHGLIAQAGDAVESIVNDPGKFVQNLIQAVLGGVQNFASNFGTHLREGVIGWLTGALGGLQMPAQWDIWGVLDIARQVLGLTWDFVRERAERIIGPKNVARLEAAFSWITTLVTEGWSALWDRLKGTLENLKNTVMEAIRNFVLERVVMASIRWLASLFNPVGAIVQLVMTIWNIFQFVSNQLQRLFGIAKTVVQGISDIAHGVLGPAMARVEQVLADLLPVVIDLLMSLLGVTGVAKRVREIIGDVRGAIAQAVDNLLERVLSTLGLRKDEADEAGEAGEMDGADESVAVGAILGEPVLVDVAEGEDHTITVEQGPDGRPVVMMRSEPQPMGKLLRNLRKRVKEQKEESRRETALSAIEQADVKHNKLKITIEELKIAIEAMPPETDSSIETDPHIAQLKKDVAQLEQELATQLEIVFDNGTSDSRHFQLKKAVGHYGIEDFLVRIAKGQSPGGIDEDRLRELWTVKRSHTYITGTFRSFKIDGVKVGVHEWIPTSYIPKVILRAREAREGNESAITAALWVKVHHAWRTPTKDIIFKPAGASRREVRLLDGRNAVVLQGHVGATYAAADSDNELSETVPVQQQTQGQPAWHQGLGNIYKKRSSERDSHKALTSMIEAVEAYAKRTVWTGKMEKKISRFDRYYEKDRSTKVSQPALIKTGENAWDSIQNGFKAARGVLK